MDIALSYDDYIALRDGKMTKERAKELGITNFQEGKQTYPVGSLHGFNCGGHHPVDCPRGGNNTSDNW